MPGISITESSRAVNGLFGAVQAPIHRYLLKRGEALEQASILPYLFDMGTSKQFGELSSGLTAMDDWEPVGENGTYPENSFEETFSKLIVHMTWKSQFSISRELVDDATVTDLRRKPENFIMAYHRTREKFGAAMYGSAIKGSTKMQFGARSFDAAGADGLALFSKVHPSKVDSKYTQSNQFADAFSVAALGAMETAMQDFRGDKGEVLAVAPDTIVIPNNYKLKNDVFASIGADKDPNTSNNAFNYQFGRWNVIVWPYLNQFITAGTSPWVLIDSNYNKSVGAAPWYDRIRLEVRSDVDDGTDANVWKGYSRWGTGFVDWRFAAVGGVSGGTQLISTGS